MQIGYRFHYVKYYFLIWLKSLSFQVKSIGISVGNTGPVITITHPYFLALLSSTYLTFLRNNELLT